MYNRKFDIKKDFHELNGLENTIIPLIDKMQLTNSLNEEENEYKRNLLKTISELYLITNSKTKNARHKRNTTKRSKRLFANAYYTCYFSSTCLEVLI